MSKSRAILGVILALLLRVVAGQNQLPVYTSLPDSFIVYESAEIGFIVANITATDPEGQRVTMFLDSTGDDIFEIVDQYGAVNDTGPSPLTRSLRLKKKLDREARQTYSFVLGVKDYFTSSDRESRESNILIVRDVNDNEPVFLNTPYVTTLKENPVSDLVYDKIEAMDPDGSLIILYYFTDECKLADCKLFQIGTKSGVVSLKSSSTLDYETRNRYNLDILAKDQGNPEPLNSTTTLFVKVEDQSDRPPEFEKSSYRADIDENTALGTEVVQIKAFDGDRGINKPVGYKIVGGDKNCYFKIDNSTGQIFVNSTIDRDIGIDYFELVVNATEIPGDASGTATVFITVQDLNDNKPTFQTEGFTYTASIPENTPVGTTIFFQMGAVDNDREARNAKFRYSISGDPEHIFKIDPRIGRIQLNKSVDFEIEQQYTFLAIASETDSVEKYSANQTIVVNITNINDHSPVFNEDQYNMTVTEGAKPGTRLGQIMASDDDMDVYGEITYSLSGNRAEMFSAEKTNGTIYVARKLNFELKPSYSIRLKATDGGNRVSEVTLNIVVTDENDETPVFVPSQATTATIDENQEHGFFVTVKATDGDSGKNAEIKYTIVEGDPLKNFTIDEITGNITNSGPLDYEIQSKFTLVIMAKDQGIPSRNTTKIVRITVTDKNDNEPYFNQTSYVISLMENTVIDYPIVQLHAFDIDSGQNAELAYSIVDGNNGKSFTINVDGVLLTRTSPDRESTSSYTLNVSASDSGFPKKCAYATVVVHILDQNDESPTFTTTVDKKIIKEGPSTLNSTVANNTATDRDLGLNGTIEYEIADGNRERKFSINSQTGEITVAKELDFETVRIYSLKIVARDKGTPALSGQYQLVVELLDINDNKPKFSQPEYSFSVTENRPSDTHIVDLLADDRDSNENKLISYSFSRGNVGGAFTINNETGRIVTTRKLDREDIPRYLLTVKAKDHGKPSLEGATNITIAVLDTNDQAPIFTQSFYNFSVSESAVKGSSVFTVVASDGDDGPAGQVRYEMEVEGNSVNGNAVFTIGSISGEVKTASTLDFEKHRSFNLTVVASDNGDPQQTSNVTLYVTISDADDNAPKFASRTWSAAVQENASRGVVIIQVNATDIDYEELHRTIYYAIASGNDDEVFGIGYENGSVYVANPGSLDRETSDIYKLTIVAQTLNEFKNETVQKSTAELTITVEDYNDYAPEFRENSYSRKIPESFELGEEIVKVTADDKDIGENQRISYFLTSGNQEGIFAVNETTGVVTIVKRLDRETTHAHTLTVTAKDHGTPSLSTNVTIAVIVSDTNDENPILIADRTTFEILENATLGTIVAEFNATDADLNQNAKVGFRIVSGNGDGVFEINNHTGVLLTVKALDHESVEEYQIGIQAFDYGSPSLQSDVKVITIDVQDTNDNPPVFIQKTVSLSVFENENPGAVVGVLVASDADASDSLYYYIIGGNGTPYFSIKDDTGVLTTTEILDREQNSTYYIYVAAFNSKQRPEYIQTLSPPHSISRKRSVVDENVVLVRITIADKNDNKPYFKYNFYKAGVSENAEYESRITQITCIDEDIGNNSKLIYKLVDLQPAELLSVESDTGWILAGQQQYFASGVGKVYSFVYSCADPMTVAETNVTIFVLVDDQRVRLTLGINDTKFVRDNIDEIKKALDDATGLEFNVDNIQYHLQSSGKYDLSKTDVFMHAVDPETNKVVDKDTALKHIDTNYGKLIDVFQNFKVNAVEPKKPHDEGDGFDVILTAAIALAAILFLLLFCFLCVICLMRRSHNRKLRAVKATGSQPDQSYGLATPGTNLHVYEGSNPVWMDPYDNWRSEHDKNSNTAKMYEGQASSMDMSRDEAQSRDSCVNPGTFYESSYHPNGILSLSMEKDEEAVTSI